ncbi:MAG TPA: glycosyltransferase [Pirellulales bacterium]|nr:glycosyltransferase [Pirellulales bacterium]
MLRDEEATSNHFDAERRSSHGPQTACDHALTVLVPAFDEEHRLPKTLTGLAEFLDASRIDYRVLVVDDGSRDATAAVSGHFGRRFSTLRLDRQRGKGAAVRRGMLAATGDVLAFTDADLPYDLSALRSAYDWVDRGECEVVFGARDLRESECRVRRKLSRTIASATFREVAKRLISREVTDTQCGLKVFSRRAAREIFSRTVIDGFAFDAEVVLLCRRLRLPTRRIAVSLVNEYGSTLSLSRHAWRMFRDVVRVGLADRLRRGRLPPVREWPESPAVEVDQPRKAA